MLISIFSSDMKSYKYKLVTHHTVHDLCSTYGRHYENVTVELIFILMMINNNTDIGFLL